LSVDRWCSLPATSARQGRAQSHHGAAAAKEDEDSITEREGGAAAALPNRSGEDYSGCQAACGVEAARHGLWDKPTAAE